MNKDEALNGGAVAVGVDVGGTKTALLATDIVTGEDLFHATLPTPAEAGPETMIAQLCEQIRRAVRESGHQPEQLAAVGLAVPGPVTGDGRVIVAGNLRGWFDIPLRDLLTRQLNVPVFADQDAKVAALGERWRGCAKEINNFVFLALGTGIGAGVVVNGRLHRGFHHAAGEVGNFLMGREYLGQDRGQHGNLELLIGGRHIREEAREAAGEELSAADALDRADEDARLRAIREEVADYLAMAVVNIAALLDPEAVIFGGGTAAAGEALLDPGRVRVER